MRLPISPPGQLLDNQMIPEPAVPLPPAHPPQIFQQDLHIPRFRSVVQRRTRATQTSPVPSRSTRSSTLRAAASPSTAHSTHSRSPVKPRGLWRKPEDQKAQPAPASRSRPIRSPAFPDTSRMPGFRFYTDACTRRGLPDRITSHKSRARKRTAQLRPVVPERQTPRHSPGRSPPRYNRRRAKTLQRAPLRHLCIGRTRTPPAGTATCADRAQGNPPAPNPRGKCLWPRRFSAAKPPLCRVDVQPHVARVCEHRQLRDRVHRAGRRRAARSLPLPQNGRCPAARSSATVRSRASRSRRSRSSAGIARTLASPSPSIPAAFFTEKWPSSET